MANEKDLREGPFPLHSTSIKMYICPTCDYLHVTLENADGQPYTEAVMDEGMLLSGLKIIYEHRRKK